MREYKPVKVTKEQIEDYQFTKKQIAAYNSLKKAVARCYDSGLCLFGKQDSLTALPAKFYNNDMTTVDQYEHKKGVVCPYLREINISDSGADDTDFIKDAYINK